MSKSRRQKIISILTGIALGFLVWTFSSIITGEPEPWDAEKNEKYYPIALFLAGFIASIPCPKRYLLATLGIYLGQMLFLLIFRFGPLFLVGTITIAFYTIISFFGAFLCYKIIPFQRVKSNLADKD